MHYAKTTTTTSVWRVFDAVQKGKAHTFYCRIVKSAWCSTTYLVATHATHTHTHTIQYHHNILVHVSKIHLVRDTRIRGTTTPNNLYIRLYILHQIRYICVFKRNEVNWCVGAMPMNPTQNKN